LHDEQAALVEQSEQPIFKVKRAFDSGSAHTAYGDQRASYGSHPYTGSGGTDKKSLRTLESFEVNFLK
jgi:hypothetical protein